MRGVRRTAIKSPSVPEDSFRRGYDARRRPSTGHTTVATHANIDHQEAKVLCGVLHPGVLERTPKKKGGVIDRCQRGIRVAVGTRVFPRVAP